MPTSLDAIRALIDQDGVARQQFERLKHDGADEAVLLGMLVNLGNYSPDWDAFKVNSGGLDRRQVRAAASKIREVATLIDRTRWLLYTKTLTQVQEAELEGLAKMVAKFGDDLNGALSRPDLSHKAPTFWDHALLMLMVYLKKASGKFADSPVSDLLTAVLQKTVDETTVRQWRYRHEKLIDAKLALKPPSIT